MNDASKSCWILTDGSAGMISQALGVADCLSYQPLIKNIKLKQPWKTLSPYFHMGLSCAIKDPKDLFDQNKWPELVIACGRQAILPAIYMKKKAKGRTKIIYVQNPKLSSKYFDAVVCPNHDDYSGPNVVNMIGASHKVNQTLLQEAKSEFKGLFEQYRKPYFGILIGGNSKAYKMDLTSIRHFFAQLELARKELGGSFFITTSRRTPEAVQNWLKQKYTKDPDCYLWDGEDKNPYFGMLSFSDALFVTCESVSMLSETSYTNKPVYMIKLTGGAKRINYFQNELLDLDRVHWFDGKVSLNLRQPIDEKQAVADQLKVILGLAN